MSSSASCHPAHQSWTLGTSLGACRYRILISSSVVSPPHSISVFSLPGLSALWSRTRLFHKAHFAAAPYGFPSVDGRQTNLFWRPPQGLARNVVNSRYSTESTLGTGSQDRRPHGCWPLTRSECAQTNVLQRPYTECRPASPCSRTYSRTPFLKTKSRVNLPVASTPQFRIVIVNSARSMSITRSTPSWP